MKATSMKRYAPRRYAFTYEALYELRQVKRLSWGQIARKYGCNHTTVIYACDRLGIPRERPLLGADRPAGKGWTMEAAE